MDKALTGKRPPVVQPSLGRYRLLVLSRAVAAIFGGYALAATFAACMGFAFQKFGMTRPDAVTGATMLAFIVHAASSIWVFACVTTRKAWLGIALSAAALAVGVWCFGGFQ